MRFTTSVKVRGEFRKENEIVYDSTELAVQACLDGASVSVDARILPEGKTILDLDKRIQDLSKDKFCLLFTERVVKNESKPNCGEVFKSYFIGKKLVQASW
jgi:hypothetical protein